MSQKGDRKKALTFFINRWSLSMSLSCCSSFSVRLKSHDVSYTSVSMVTKSSHRSCSPGMWRSFPSRTSDRAQSTYQHHKKRDFQETMKSVCHTLNSGAIRNSNRWLSWQENSANTLGQDRKINNQSSALIWSQDLSMEKKTCSFHYSHSCSCKCLLKPRPNQASIR